MTKNGALYDIDSACYHVEWTISPLLVDLLGEFGRREIAYCYWKSSRRVHAVLAGEGDVDLLVAADDQHRIQEVLLERGFKLFASVCGREHPATSSFIGYDHLSDRLLHVHLHARLMLGEPLLKNYRVPWEAALLSRAVYHPTLPIRLLDPVSEAVLLVVRACLELRWCDPVAFRNRRETALKFALDREELAARTTPTSVRDLACELMDEDLAEKVSQAVHDARAWESLGALRRRIRSHFAPHRTYNTFEARTRSLARSVQCICGRLNKNFLHLPRPWNRRAPGGGRVIALVGVDGSGKSTAVASMRAWLGSMIDVVPVYFGTGDGRPSLLLWPLKLMMPLITRMLDVKPRRATDEEPSGDGPGLLYSVLLAVWATAVAAEKRSKLAAAHRAANRGLIVITDRYPQDETASFNDSPLLNRLKRAPAWLRRFELAAYALARRLPPDLVIKLEAMPETIGSREPGMSPARIRQRVAALKGLQFPGAKVVSVDAELPLPDVLRAVRREIWRVL